jgi:hypothetical protein
MRVDDSDFDGTWQHKRIKDREEDEEIGGRRRVQKV